MARKKDKDRDVELIEELEAKTFSADVSSMANQLRTNRNKERFENDTMKAISAIAKQQRDTSKLINQRELSYSKGIVEVDRSTRTILKRLGYTVDEMSRSARKIMMITANTAKNTITGMGRALNEEIRLNKANTVGMALAASSPIFGYFAAKFIETGVFRDFADKIKERLTDSVSFVTRKFKSFFDTFRGKKFGEVVTIIGDGIKSLLKFPFKLFGAGIRSVLEITKFVVKLPFKAIGMMFGGIFKFTKFIMGLPFKAITLGLKALLLPFKMIGGALGAVKSGFKFDFGNGGGNDYAVPQMATGGYVKKGGIAKLHAGEVVTPIGKFYKEFTRHFKDALDVSSLPVELRKLRVGIQGLGSNFTTSLMESLLRGKIARKLVGLYGFFNSLHSALTFIVRPKGKYARQLPRGFNPLQNTATILGMLYSGMMNKMDQLLRIFGGDPEDESQKAGNRIDDTIGIWGKVKDSKKKKSGGFFSGISGLFSGGGFSFSDISQDESNKASKGFTSYFSSWKKREKERDIENNKKKKKHGWITTILIFGWQVVKSVGSLGLAALVAGIAGIGKLATLILKGGFGAIGQSFKFIPKLLSFLSGKSSLAKGGVVGTIFQILRKQLSLGLTIAGAAQTATFGGLDFLTGMLRSKSILGKDKVSWGERKSVGAASAISSQEGGLFGALEGAIKYGGPVRTPISIVLGAIVGYIGAKRLLGLKRNISGLGKLFIGGAKFAGVIAYGEIIKPIISGISDLTKYLFNSIIVQPYEKINSWIGQLIGPTIDKLVGVYGKISDSIIEEYKKSGLKPVVDSISGMISGIIQHTRWILSSLFDAFIHSPKTFLKWLKTGTNEVLSVAGGNDVDWAVQYKNLIQKPMDKYKKSKGIGVVKDSGGFVGGSSLHRSIIAHKDEYVVNPELSRQLNESYRRTGTPPSKIIGNAIKGGDSSKRIENKLDQASGSIAGSILAGFRMMAEASTMGNFIGKGFSGIATGARKVAEGVGKSFSYVGSAVGNFLGLKTEGKIDLSRVQPSLMQKISSMAEEYKALTGRDIVFTSGFRSAAYQASLKGGYMTAAPGMSMHQYGYAVDIKKNIARDLESKGLLSKYGLVRPYGENDPVHIEPIEIQGKRHQVRAGEFPGGLNGKQLAMMAASRDVRQSRMISDSLKLGVNGNNEELNKNLKLSTGLQNQSLTMLQNINNNILTSNTTQGNAQTEPLSDMLLRGDFS